MGVMLGAGGSGWGGVFKRGVGDSFVICAYPSYVGLDGLDGIG